MTKQADPIKVIADVVKQGNETKPNKNSCNSIRLFMVAPLNVNFCLCPIEMKCHISRSADVGIRPLPSKIIEIVKPQEYVNLLLFSVDGDGGYELLSET
jgi:hypothetical protein